MQVQKVEIIAGAVCVDHVHLCVSISPKLSISDFVGYLKGKSALMVYDKHPDMESKWDRSFWARGYYVTTIGNVKETLNKAAQRIAFTCKPVFFGRSLEYQVQNGHKTAFFFHFYDLPLIKGRNYPIQV